MSLQIRPCFKVKFLVFVLLIPISISLNVSQDTLRTINQNKVYKYGVDFRRKTQYPDITLAKATGAVALARLEYEIHQTMINKISSRSRPDESNFTRDLLEYVEDYRATSGSFMHSGIGIENSVVSIAENMIAVYRMVRRFRNYIQPWISEQKKRKALPFQIEVLEAINPSGKILDLSTDDFQLSLIPIIAAQFYLDWKPEDICKGTIQGMELGSTLKVVHCLEIGVHAIASGMYPIGIEWIQEAISKAAHESDMSANLQLATNLLERACAKHDERWRPKNVAHLVETFYVTRLNESVNGKEKKLSRKWRKEREHPRGNVEAEAQDMEKFSKMCQGNVKQPEHIKSKLYCWLETSVHPTWKIGPLKVELLSAFPDDVVLFHDVISKSLTEDFIKFGKPRRQFGHHELTFVNPKTRLSFGCAVVEYPSLERRLDGLIQRMTGLQTKDTSENFISSYPAGGHMNLHTDNMSAVGEGDCFISSLLFYFTAPEVGGETVITGSTVCLKPPAGSAVLWYFTYKSGAILRTGRAHGSCPLVKGLKWVNVKEVDYLKQTHLVCDMDEHAKMEYLVNGRSKYT